jgi:hypothetical protein
MKTFLQWLTEDGSVSGASGEVTSGEGLPANNIGSGNIDLYSLPLGMVRRKGGKYGNKRSDRIRTKRTRRIQTTN